MTDDQEASPFAIRSAAHQPICEAGYIYGVHSDGQIIQIAPNGSVTDLGDDAGASSFNGLGIGADGATVYGYERSSSGNERSVSRATIHSFNVTTGEWRNRGYTINSNDWNRTVQFIGGAFNLDTGRYFLGGFNSTGSRFRLWEYNPSTNSSVYKGEVDTSGGGGSLNNGDIAFDNAGNLFIVRGVDNETTVFSVTAANLQAATGGTIPGAIASSVRTMTGVNGAAFDSSGRIFLGAGHEMRSYAMPSINDRRDVTSSLVDSTDLASCSSPPTITVEKVVEGSRVADSDQFTLTLNQGRTLVARATTTGTDSGVQSDRIGPLPVAAGAELTFNETATGGTDLANYSSSTQCTVDGQPMVFQPASDGRGGRVTMPSRNAAVLCQIHNSPLPVTADVEITKTLQDYDGTETGPGVDWTVGAATQATTGSVTTAPASATQQTDANGRATWELNFGSARSRATITVSETQQTGYEFVSGQCEVSSLDGSVRTVTLDSEAAQGITNVVPGDEVRCEYVNTVAGAELTLQKDLDTRFDPNAGIDQWTLTAAGPTTDITGVTGSAAVTDVEAAPGEYTLSEQLIEEHAAKADGYEAVSLVCTDADSGTITSVSLGNPTLTLEPGTDVACVFTNRDLPGSAEWIKVDGSTGEDLTGSEWSITGPGHPDGLAVTGDDAGAFLVEDLVWGDYKLQETRAPVGYKLSGETHRLTVGPGGASGLAEDLGQIENDPQDPLTLPLTGGVGSLPFWLGGGLLAVLAVAFAWWNSRRGGRVSPRE